MKIEIVVPDKDVEDVIGIIVRHARRGEPPPETARYSCFQFTMS